MLLFKQIIKYGFEQLWSTEHGWNTLWLGCNHHRSNPWALIRAVYRLFHTTLESHPEVYSYSRCYFTVCASLTQLQPHRHTASAREPTRKGTRYIADTSRSPIIAVNQHGKCNADIFLPDDTCSWLRARSSWAMSTLHYLPRRPHYR